MTDDGIDPAEKLTQQIPKFCHYEQQIGIALCE